MYAARNPPEEPPCYKCRVDILPENEDAQKIFNVTRHQLIIAGMDGIIVDINHVAVHQAMRLYRVKNKARCFEKVLAVGRWWVNELNKKRSR